MIALSQPYQPKRSRPAQRPRVSGYVVALVMLVLVGVVWRK